MTAPLSESQAFVFLGCIRARKGDTADEEAIKNYANEERRKRERNDLDTEQVRKALLELQSLKCVEEIKSKLRAWRIIEACKGVD